MSGSDDSAASVSGAAGVSGAKLNDASGAYGDRAIEDGSSAAMVAPVGISVLSWLGADASAGVIGAGVTGVGETGVGDTGGIETITVGDGASGAGARETVGVEDCVTAAEDCAGRLKNEGAAADAAWLVADGRTETFGLTSVGAVDDEDVEAGCEDVVGEGAEDPNFSKTARGGATAFT